MDIRKLMPAELSSRYVIINGLWHYYSAEDVEPLNPKAISIVEDEIDGEWIESKILNLEYLFFKAPSAELEHLMRELSARDFKSLEQMAGDLGIDKYEMPKQRITTPQQGKKNTRLTELLQKVKETNARNAKKEKQDSGTEVVTDNKPKPEMKIVL